MSYQILQGDVIEMLRTLEDESVDAVVTDPPYGIRFMGKAWDGADIVKTMNTKMRKDTIRSDGYKRNDGVAFASGTYCLNVTANRAFQEWTRAWATEAIRVLKPGAHLLCFASTRTYHRMASGVEDAGFEIRDQIGWVFGSGFPKSHNLHGEWEGWGTALKPAWEPIVMARKPLQGTVAENVEAHGTGALNIAGCRIEGEATPINRTEQWTGFGQMERPEYVREINTLGRWPANLIHDGSDEVIAVFPVAEINEDTSRTGSVPKTSGIYGSWKRSDKEQSLHRTYAEQGATNLAAKPGARRFDEGSAARFFYCAKASRQDRNEGCEDFVVSRESPHWDPTSQRGKEHSAKGWGVARNSHPTVKPTDLMRYLCCLVTPPAGTVLDCFMGSGSTGKAALYEGFKFIGIEREADYCSIAEARMRNVEETDAPLLRKVSIHE